LRWLRCAAAVAAVAHKNQTPPKKSLQCSPDSLARFGKKNRKRKGKDKPKKRVKEGNKNEGRQCLNCRGGGLEG